MSVHQIGKCPGCRAQSALKNGCCRSCSRFGPNFGELATRIRSDAEFKRKCYEMLKTDLAREGFISTFGPITPATGSVDMAGGSR